MIGNNTKKMRTKILYNPKLNQKGKRRVMTKLRNNKRINILIRNILIGISLFLVGCEDTIQDSPPIIQYDMRLPIDDNGYYHLEMNRGSWQTIHRVSGSISDDFGAVMNEKVYWESDLMWYLGDTLGYVVKRGLTVDLEYVSYDTVYVTGYSGMEVPTSNMASYSNSDGEINNMIAPVRSMIGDTLTLSSYYDDGWKSFKIVLD